MVEKFIKIKSIYLWSPPTCAYLPGLAQSVLKKGRLQLQKLCAEKVYPERFNIIGIGGTGRNNFDGFKEARFAL